MSIPPEIVPIALPTPYRVDEVYAYLVNAEPLTLIDAGSRVADWHGPLQRALAPLGYQPADIRRVVLTHGHHDHIGLAGWLQQLGAEVWLHPLDFGKMFEEPWWRDGHRRLWEYCGLPAAIWQRIEDEFARTAQTALPLPAAEAIRPLKHGDSVPFANFELEVLETPGHSLGHVAFWWGEKRILFAGDLLLEGRAPAPLAEPLPAGGHALTLEQFFTSCDRVIEKSVRAALPGHGPIIHDVSGLIHSYTSSRDRRLEQVYAGLPAGGATVYELFCRLHPRAGTHVLFLLISDILAHLDALVQAGGLRTEPAVAGSRLYIRM